MVSSKTKKALHFAGKEVAKGALQATGSILIYVAVLWAIYSNFFSSKGRDTLDSALKLKAPGMTKLLDRQHNNGTVAPQQMAYI